MGWELWIGGRDYSPYCDFATWTFHTSLRHRGATANGAVSIRNKAFRRPRVLEEIRLLHTDPDWTLFGGVVQDVSQRQVDALGFDYAISAGDYTRWLDHIPVGAIAYADMTIDALVMQLISDWATRSGGLPTPFGQPPPGVPISAAYYPAGHVQAMSILKYGFQGQYMSLSQTIDTLAKEAYAVWFIDQDKGLWLALPDAVWLAAPPAASAVQYFSQDLAGNWPRGLVTESLPTIFYDTDTKYKELIVRETAANVISGVTVRDYYAASDDQVTENDQNNKKLIGDGQTRFFPLYNMPIDPAHTLVTVEGGSPAMDKRYTEADGNLKTEYVDGQPSDGDPRDYCYVCTSNQGIRFNVAPSDGSIITISYNYYNPSAFDAQHNYGLAAEIARREGYGPGFYYQSISMGQAFAPISLREGTPEWLAQELIALNRYARIKLVASFKTYEAGWRPGQTFAIVSPNRGDSVNQGAYNLWGTTFSQKFYVTQTSTRIVNADVAETTVEAASDIWGE